MIGKALLIIAILILSLTAYVVMSDNLKIELEGNGVIVDQVVDTGEGLENEIIDFNKPERGYS